MIYLFATIGAAVLLTLIAIGVGAMINKGEKENVNKEEK